MKILTIQVTPEGIKGSPLPMPVKPLHVWQGKRDDQRTNDELKEKEVYDSSLKALHDSMIKFEDQKRITTIVHRDPETWYKVEKGYALKPNSLHSCEIEAEVVEYMRPSKNLPWLPRDQRRPKQPDVMEYRTVLRIKPKEDMKPYLEKPGHHMNKINQKRNESVDDSKAPETPLTPIQKFVIDEQKHGPIFEEAPEAEDGCQLQCAVGPWEPSQCPATECPYKTPEVVSSKQEPASDMKCVAGCKHFTGGEIKHHKDCPFYPESFSKMYDDLKSQSSPDNKEGQEELAVLRGKLNRLTKFVKGLEASAETNIYFQDGYNYVKRSLEELLKDN